MSRRPDDIVVCDGESWTVEFVFADGIMHRRRGETYGEPEGYDGLRDELDAFKARVVCRK